MFKEMFKSNQSFMLQLINNKLTEGSMNTNSSLVQNPVNHVISNSNVSVNGNMTNVNQSNNKTFNLNMFLNEKCKDAMNITEFFQKIELDTYDMEDVGKHGFVKGISNIFISNLEKTEITKRPIHCSDVKREVLYIKEAGLNVPVVLGATPGQSIISQPVGTRPSLGKLAAMKAKL